MNYPIVLPYFGRILTAFLSARTLGGQAYTAVMSVTALRWDLPLTFVSSADRAQMAAWWAAETELLLTLDGSGTNVAGAFVRIVNEREPLPRLVGGLST